MTTDELCERLLTLAADCEIGESNYCVELADAAKEAGTTLRDLIQQQRAEIERLSAALEFYSHEWEQDEHGGPGETYPSEALYRDRGSTARAALGKEAK